MKDFNQQLMEQKNVVKTAQKEFAKSESLKQTTLIEPEKKVNLKLDQHLQGNWPSSKNVSQ